LLNVILGYDRVFQRKFAARLSRSHQGNGLLLCCDRLSIVTILFGQSHRGQAVRHIPSSSKSPRPLALSVWPAIVYAQETHAGKCLKDRKSTRLNSSHVSIS